MHSPRDARYRDFRRVKPPPALAALAAVCMAGCAATIIPPNDPDAPRAAYILDHGRHTTLVVVDSNDRPVRYAFGQLNAYADGDIGFFRGMAAMLMPGPGTLGRRVLPGPPTPDNVLEAVGVDVENLYCVAVSGAASDRLQRILDLTFEQNRPTARYVAGWNLEFVKNPEDYWFGTTANEAVENWLVELGCEVKGTTAFANWNVQQPPGGAPAVCVEAD